MKLLDEGATVPFVARYRKEATGGLDDIQLRHLEERLRYLRELAEQRDKVLTAIREQGKLTPELERKIRAADTKARLEDLYLPYRKKRRTRAMIAREAGLEPLAMDLLRSPSLTPETHAAAFVAPDKGVHDVAKALEGARHILVEHFSEDADLLERLRTHMREHGVIASAVHKGKEQEGARFRDWFDYSEAIQRVPSHRALALFRGRKEEILSVSLVDGGAGEGVSPSEWMIAHAFSIAQRGRPADAWLCRTVELAWRGRLSVRTELALMTELRERAEATAIEVFATNLRDLLLAAPAGPQTTLGLDPGIRTGVKVAVVDHTGKVLDTATIYPFQPRRDVEGSLHVLEGLVRKHGITLIAIGNGTASRETDRLTADLIKRLPAPHPTKVVVHEAGASVYSASALASQELPDLDVSLRGAVSIARRLQDPLAELVKIDPKSIGVGQYQHDVSQTLLARSLDHVVEDCVNAVGVDLNTASPALLQRVAGLSSTLAKNVVSWRDDHGAFESRKQLLKVPRLGARTFEQCAGFLRIRGGKDPLDASAVHPEAYPVVRRMSESTGTPVRELVGATQLLKRLRAEEFTDTKFGLPTVRDILAELDKPGRDPRPEFETATFAEGIETLSDLRPGMSLQGTVTNVTAFGAFVDLGVHQDGLVHISQLADRFVKDPREVVRAGQVVQVRVVEVDLARKRIALTMRKEGGDAPRPQQDRNRQGRGGPDHGKRPARSERPRRPPERPRNEGNSTLGDLFRKGRK